VVDEEADKRFQFNGQPLAPVRSRIAAPPGQGLGDFVDGAFDLPGANSWDAA